MMPCHDRAAPGWQNQTLLFVRCGGCKLLVSPFSGSSRVVFACLPAVVLRSWSLMGFGAFLPED